MTLPLSRALLAALTGALVLAAGPALAGAPAGATGHDISYPQCGAAFPVPGAFGIVGVNNGRVYSANPCLAEQAVWAASTGNPALYVNTANPGPVSAYWPAPGSKQPVPCRDTTVETDMGCAYDYGWNAAIDALITADQAVQAFKPRSVTWWLDVESANSWTDVPKANVAALQGFADRLRVGGVPSVGIYSVPSAWDAITGGFTKSNAASYRSAWASAFSPQYPLELSPVWRAGVGNVDDANAACSVASFTGGPLLLQQHFDDTSGTRYDGDVQCAAESTDGTAPKPVTTAPGAVTLSSTVGVRWSSDGGASSYDVRYRRAAPTQGFGNQAYPSGWQVTTAHAATIGGAPGGYTYCFSTRARDARPNLSTWSAERCTAVALDDRALSASSGWARAASSAYYASTYTATTRLGATLTKSGLQTSRLAVVATRCPSCGVIGVYVGGTLLKKLDLRSASTLRKQVLALPPISLRTASVTIKVLSSGKTVQIDGLSTARA